MVLALVLTCGLVAGAESAVTALRPSRLDDILKRHRRTARYIKTLREAPERLFATTVVLSNLALVAAAVWVGYRLVPKLEQSFATMVEPRAFAHALALAVAMGATSAVFIVFATLVPKSLAQRSAASAVSFFAPPLYVASLLLAPAVFFFTRLSNFILAFFSDKTSFTESRLSPDELSHLVNEATRAGLVHPKAGDIAVRALDFGDVIIGDIMLPRTLVVALPLDASPAEVRRVLLEENHAHFPIYDGTLDEIVGVVSTSDVLMLAWERELFVLQDLMRPPIFVPETMRAAEVLSELQRERLHFAVVVDETGGTAGIVTLRDLIEELVGKLLDRHEQPDEKLRAEPGGSFLVPGNMAIRDANRELPFSLPEGEDFTTVGGLVILLAGRLPWIGERFSTDDGITLEVADASTRRVRAVRVSCAR